MAKSKQEAIVALFGLARLILEDGSWTMRLNVGTTLPQSFREYSVRFTFNPESWDTKIRLLKSDIQKIENAETLFEKGPASRESLIAEKRASVKRVEKERAVAKKQCPDIKMAGIVTELKYKVAVTVLTMSIPADKIAAINDHREMFRQEFYRVELVPGK